ncbi:hypothetical protein MAR_000566, partial [Mya arenaria]
CKDDRGEPRSNILNETSKDGRYSFSCYDYTIGVKCVVKKLDGKCPDFAINIFCNCTAGPRSLTTKEITRTRTTTRTTTITTKRISLKTPKLTTTGKIATTLPTSIGVSASTPLYRFQSFSRGSTSETLDPPRTTMTTAVVGSKSTGNEPNRNTLDIGSLSIKWWQFLLILTVILFLVSLITSLCLFRRATALLRASKGDSTLPSAQINMTGCRGVLFVVLCLRAVADTNPW